MTLTRKDFDAFFALLHGKNAPFDWQRRLLDSVLDSGRWPDRIVAPTGSGKTAVIDVHVFAQALHASGDATAPRPPRRLAMVVNRRVLVDDQHDHATEIARRLAEPDDPLLAEIARLLWLQRRPGSTGDRERGESPLVVARLRGALPPSRAWRDEPTAAAVICATPDMWGSRVLFGGYGSSRLAWPREAGLLTVDAAVVVDEAHLSHQLLRTARRVAELVPVAERAPHPVALQVVEVTATPADDGETRIHVDVTDADLADPRLGRRLTLPKPVTVLPVDGWAATTTRAAKAPVTALADAVLGLVGSFRHESGPATVGCFVNSVARAVQVVAELHHRTNLGVTPRVALVCGQMRPYDLEELRHRFPGLLSVAGNGEVDVLVSTQSLEVGVDLDLAAIVTELAPGGALAQRVGRVNRLGHRANGPVTVVVPAEPITEKTRSGPYGHEELIDALAWLERSAKSPDGLSPWMLRGDPPPPPRRRRPLLQRVELADAWHWARTSDDLAADPELDLWLTDDFENDPSVGIVVRAGMPRDSADALRLVQDLSPMPHEVFPARYWTAITALSALPLALDTEEHERREMAGDDDRLPALVRVRGEEGTVLNRPPEGIRPEDVPTFYRGQLRPGDLLVVDATTAMFSGPPPERRRTTEDPPTQRVIPPVVISPDLLGGVDPVAVADVLTGPARLDPDGWRQRERGRVALRIETGIDGITAAPFARLREALPTDDQDDEGQAEDAERKVVHDWLVTETRLPAMADSAARLLAESPPRYDLMLHRDPDGQLLRVLIRDRRRATLDEALRQVWSPSGKAVTLDAHQRAVAARAVVLATELGLPDDLVAALEHAGAHHDDGKADPRFQTRLGAKDEDATLLAKSRGLSPTTARRYERESGLPSRWRHEQRSVVAAWETLHTADGVDPLLAARLVGTSHGHGHTDFPHVADGLVNPGDPLLPIARELFDLGGWDDLIETTQRRYGVWGCAYLEAVLRAADCQVSQEGS